MKAGKRPELRPIPQIYTNSRGWVLRHPTLPWVVISPPGLSGLIVPPPANDLAPAA